MVAWSQAREQVRRTQGSETIPTAADLVDEHELLERELRQVRADESRDRSTDIGRIAARLIELEEQIRASEWTFTFVALEKSRYRALTRAHPPTDEQKAEAAEQQLRLYWNPETFPQALLGASCLRVVTAAGERVEGIDWSELWETWGNGPTARLWRLCLAVNEGVAEAPKSTAASALTASSEKS